MSSRRRRKSGRWWGLSFEALCCIAGQIWEEHTDWISRGDRLLPSSFIRRQRNGTLTARLVYRRCNRQKVIVTVTMLDLRIDAA